MWMKEGMQLGGRDGWKEKTYLSTDFFDTTCNDVGQSSGITKVGVDASQDRTSGRSDRIHNDMSLNLCLAVSTGSVELSECVDSEAADGKGATTVVLENLVIGAEGTAALDSGCFTSSLLFDGEGIFADCAPPNIVQRAGTLAMNTLDLIGANNDVGDRGTVGEDEDSVFIAALLLTGTIYTAVELLETSIEVVSRSDGLGGGENRCTRGSWE